MCEPTNIHVLLVNVNVGREWGVPLEKNSVNNNQEVNMSHRKKLVALIMLATSSEYCYNIHTPCTCKALTHVDYKHACMSHAHEKSKDFDYWIWGGTLSHFSIQELRTGTCMSQTILVKMLGSSHIQCTIVYLYAYVCYHETVKCGRPF